MKRYLLLLAFLVSTFLPIAAADEYVKQITIKIQEPAVGAIPTYEASVDQHQNIRVAEVIWTGEFDNGKFIRGRNYTVAVRVMIDESSPYMFAKPSQSVITINGKKGQVTSFGQKKMKIEYDWKELGGPNPDLPENKLETKLKELAAAYIATNTTNKDDVLKYLKKEMPNAEVWLAGGAYQSTQLLPTETEDGNFSITIGITKGSVTLDRYSFTVTIPARNKSPYAQKLNEDMILMKRALKDLMVTAKTTGKEVLAAVNAASIHGTKATWGNNYAYNAPTSSLQGGIHGDIILTLGDKRDIIAAHKVLPKDGSATDAAIDTDFSALSKALSAHTMTNKTTEQEVIEIATAAIKNGSKLTCTSFIKTDATYDNDGKLVANFELELNGVKRAPRISRKIAKVRVSLPTEIAVSHDEWEVLRLTNIERYKQGISLLVMIAPLQDAGDIRAKEITIDYRKDHKRPDGSSCFTAIDPSFNRNRKMGENGYRTPTTPAQAVTGWMNSPGHRANILTREFVLFGCGVTTSNGIKHWIQMFAAGGGIRDVQSSTGSFHFDSVVDMEDAYLICDINESYKAYVPLEAEYMVQNGNQYTIHLVGKSVTVTVGNN